MRAFRFDDREFSEGDLIPYRGDCALMLSTDELIVETAIREYTPESEGIRSQAQYFYRDEDFARRIARHDKRNLYEVEIAESDITHQGDLNYYSAAKNALKAGLPLDEHVSGYWSGLEAGASWTSPRYEVLAKNASVVRKL